MSTSQVSREEFDRLVSLVEQLQTQIATLAQPTSVAQDGPDAEIPEDVLEVIAAVIAAYLGKRATIKFVRRVNEAIDPWRTQGRVNVQASRQMPQMRGL